MARVSDSERGALRQAADTARSVLPKLRDQRASLEERIASLESVIKADELFNGTRREDSSQASSVSDSPKSQRVRKGQVARHVDEVLSEGTAMDEPTIREKIGAKFGESYGRATVYTALRRGARNHRYLKDGKLWRLGLVTVKSA
jgi:hypothetical protein